MSGPISNRIRSNVWAIAVCFGVAMGAAVVASASDEGSQATTSASAAKQIKKLKKVVAAQGARIAALEAKPATPTGPASGDLTGSYPSPQLGPAAVGSAELDSDVDALNIGGPGYFGLPTPWDGMRMTAGGIDFRDNSNPTSLIRSDGSALFTGFVLTNGLNPGHISLFQTGDPGTPVENQVFIYVRNNGGTAELVAEWDNNTDVIAIE